MGGQGEVAYFGPDSLLGIVTESVSCNSTVMGRGNDIRRRCRSSGSEGRCDLVKKAEAKLRFKCRSCNWSWALYTHSAIQQEVGGRRVFKVPEVVAGGKGAPCLCACAEIPGAPAWAGGENYSLPAAGGSVSQRIVTHL